MVRKAKGKRGKKSKAPSPKPKVRGRKGPGAKTLDLGPGTLDSNGDGFYVPTQKDLARLFDVKPISIEKWKAKGGPELGKGKRGYDLHAWIAFRVAEKLRDDEDAQLARRKRLVDIELKEDQRDRNRKQLVPAGDAQRQRIELLTWMVAVLERAGTELAADLAGVEAGAVRRIVQAYFDALRSEAAGKKG